MDKLDYLNYAENDYKFTVEAYKSGLRGNALGYLAEQTCEKYIKHAICIAQGIDASIPGEAPRFSLDETHSPGKLVRKLRDYGISIPGSFVHEMNTLASCYRDIRYPGYYTSHTIEEEEIKDCMLAMKHCRENILSIIKNIELKKLSEKENEEIDFGL